MTTLTNTKVQISFEEIKEMLQSKEIKIWVDAWEDIITESFQIELSKYICIDFELIIQYEINKYQESYGEVIRFANPINIDISNIIISDLSNIENDNFLLDKSQQIELENLIENKLQLTL